MARATIASKRTEPESVTVEYDLFDLPTAQHKAGLAGLLLQIRSMRDRKQPEESIPAIEELAPTRARVRFTRRSVQGLFDDLYDAEIAEVAVKSKWPSQTPKRIEEVEEADAVTGRPKTSKRFIYDVVQPRGHFLRQYLPDPDREFGWLKLWRDMLWAIPRGIPKTRIPFEQRAAERPCKEGTDAWEDLVRVHRARAANAFHTSEVGSALWLGAQAVNAELIPFQGRAEQNLLLHFWVLTTLIFVPRLVNDDGEGEFVGYALAIPEVVDVEAFCEDYPLLLAELPGEVWGYRPAAAVIDLPAQAALEFMEHLARLVQHAAERKKRISFSVSSIEYLHLAKFGNNVKTMASGRVAPRPKLLDDYRQIAGSHDQPSPYRNPLFRSGLMLALLQGREWYECMGDMLVERPWPFFVRSEKTPRQLPWFSADAAEKFRRESLKYRQEREALQMTAAASGGAPPESPPEPASPLPQLIYRLVQTYVWRKTEEKCGLKWEDFKKVKDERTGKERTDVPQEYRDAKERVISDTFLAMRSRREQDFVDYFTAAVCSVGQFLPDKDYQVVARALLEQPETIKTLSMLALSANS